VPHQTATAVAAAVAAAVGAAVAAAVTDAWPLGIITPTSCCQGTGLQCAAASFAQQLFAQGLRYAKPLGSAAHRI
jgi:gamma-glutamyltranspeptidase